MISLQTLHDRLDGNWVAFNEHGDVLDLEIPSDIGPATLLVSEVTDAVKRLEGGRVVESFDRRRIWAVDAIVLNRVVLGRLGAGSMSADDLLTAVRSAGYAWQISPTSAP